MIGIVYKRRLVEVSADGVRELDLFARMLYYRKQGMEVAVRFANTNLDQDQIATL